MEEIKSKDSLHAIVLLNLVRGMLISILKFDRVTTGLLLIRVCSESLCRVLICASLQVLRLVVIVCDLLGAGLNVHVRMNMAHHHITISYIWRGDYF